jgi:hypothetical protein
MISKTLCLDDKLHWGEGQHLHTLSIFNLIKIKRFTVSLCSMRKNENNNINDLFILELDKLEPLVYKTT